MKKTGKIILILSIISLICLITIYLTFYFLYIPKGSQGPQGSAGNQGPSVEGPTGSQGSTGATGIVVQWNPIGSTGIRGPKGIAGSIGPTGVTGITGSTGTYNSPYPFQYTIKWLNSTKGFNINSISYMYYVIPSQYTSSVGINYDVNAQPGCFFIINFVGGSVAKGVYSAYYKLGYNSTSTNNYIVVNSQNCGVILLFFLLSDGETLSFSQMTGLDYTGPKCSY